MDRLLGAVQMEIYEGWGTGRHYVNLETYWAKRGVVVAEEPALTT